MPDLNEPQLRLLAGDHHLLTTPEAASILRLKPRTLEGLRVQGTGPRYYKMGPGRMARVVYRRADLEAWVEQFGFNSTSEYE